MFRTPYFLLAPLDTSQQARLTCLALAGRRKSRFRPALMRANTADRSLAATDAIDRARRRLMLLASEMLSELSTIYCAGRHRTLTL